MFPGFTLGRSPANMLHLKRFDFNYTFGKGTVYPDLVARSADGQIETVKYQLLYPMLLNELQKQNVTIAAQKEHIAAQDQRIQTLEERLAKVEAALSGSTVTAAAR